jgi:putative transposase
MPNLRRIVLPGLPHHICHRGNFRQPIFFRDSDRRLYLDLLAEHSRHHGVSIQAWCLMPNHVHVIATPHDSNGLHYTFERVEGDYARSLHIRLHRRGHLWQGRFRSSPMDEKHFWAAMIYVEQNPVRARLADTAEQWRWSSTRARLADRPGTLLDLTEWRARYTPEQWRQCLTLGLEDSALLERIRESTRLGRPAAEELFLSQLGSKLGRNLLPRKPGRPRKPVASEGVDPDHTTRSASA